MRLSRILVVYWAVQLAHADILHLSDGSRYYGTLITENSATIRFRVYMPDGRSGVVRSFPAGSVRRVERNNQLTPPETGRTPQVESNAARVDLDQVMREGFLLLDMQDQAAALRALQSAVLAAGSTGIQELEQLCMIERGIRLDELLAQLRIDAAIRAGRERSFRIRFATGYESAALGRELERRTDVLLSTVNGDRPLRDWPGHEDEYKEFREDSRETVENASLAAAYLSARIKFDPRLKRDLVLRRRLIAEQAALVRFGAHVLALPGYTGDAEFRKRLKQATSAPAEQEARDLDPDPSDTDPSDSGSTPSAAPAASQPGSVEPTSRGNRDR